MPRLAHGPPEPPPRLHLGTLDTGEGPGSLHKHGPEVQETSRRCCQQNFPGVDGDPQVRSIHVH